MSMYPGPAWPLKLKAWLCTGPLAALAISSSLTVLERLLQLCDCTLLGPFFVTRPPMTPLIGLTGAEADCAGEPLEELVNEAAAFEELVMALMRRSLPRPLMPLLEFLYRDAKYSQSSLSAEETWSPSWIVANL